MARLRHRLLLASALAAGIVATGAIGLDRTGAFAQTTTQYQPWQPPSGQGTQTLIDELRRMVDQAERDRAASPDFLADLKGLLARYGSGGTGGGGASATPPATPAPTRAVFSDDFADGNYTANPTWSVLQGNWTVDGAGLRSDVPAASGGQAGGVAAIALPTRLPNAFAMAFDLQAFAGGQFELRVYQGAAREAGYRLVYRADGSPAFAIYRSGSSGIRQLSATTSAQTLPNGKARIGWTRDAAGVMRITLDGREILTATDSAFRDPWEGVLLVNFGGNFATRSIAATQ